MRMSKQEKINANFLETLAKNVDIISNDCPSMYELSDSSDLCDDGKCFLCWEIALRFIDRK